MNCLISFFKLQKAFKLNKKIKIMNEIFNNEKIKEDINNTIKISWLIDLIKSLDSEGIDAKQGIVLHELSKQTSINLKKPIVEIGSFKGISSIYITKGIKHSKQNNVLYCIDPFDGGDSPEFDLNNSNKIMEFFPKVGSTFEIFKNNISKAKVEDYIKILKGRSQDVITNFKEEISLLFIDGSHEYENVKLDFDLWNELIVKKGFLIFHDYSDEFQGVINVVEEVKKDPRFKFFNKYGSLVIFQKN